MSRSFGLTSFTTLSPTRTLPPLMSSRPAAIRSAVVLPQPEGPTRTMNSPSLTSRSSLSTARVPSPNTFETCSNRTLAMRYSLTPSAHEPALREHEHDRNRDDREDGRKRELRLEDVDRGAARRRDQVEGSDPHRHIVIRLTNPTQPVSPEKEAGVRDSGDAAALRPARVDAGRDAVRPQGRRLAPARLVDRPVLPQRAAQQEQGPAERLKEPD